MDELRQRLAPVSDSYLRKLVRASGAPLEPLVEGVRQESLAELERTLLALAAEYEVGYKAGARKLVIEAKDHARFTLKRLETEARTSKEEMILWMLTWLESPSAFPVWVRLRKAHMEANRGSAG